MKNRLFRQLPAFFALAAIVLCGMTGAGPTMAQLSPQAVAEQETKGAADPLLLVPAVAPQPDRPESRISALPPAAPVTTTKPPMARRVVPTLKTPLTPEWTTKADPDEAGRSARLQVETSSRAKVYRNVVLSEDTVWSGQVHVDGWITVPAQITLTIEAGTEVRFKPDRESMPEGAGLLIQGRLLASGRPEKPILLSGAYSKALAGDWQGVVLLSSDKKNLIEQCRIEGAVAGIEALHSQLILRDVVSSNCMTGFRFRDSFAGIAGGGASGSKLGVHAMDTELEIKDASISSNRQGVISASGSLYISGTTLYGNEEVGVAAENSKIKVAGSSLTVNGLGLSLSGCEGSIAYNRILNNRDAGIDLVNSRFKVNGNEITQNGRVGMRISAGSNSVWGNSIFSNNSHDLEYSGTDALYAMANWWGDIGPDRIPSRILRSENSGKVLYLPALMLRPQAAF